MPEALVEEQHHLALNCSHLESALAQRRQHARQGREIGLANDVGVLNATQMVDVKRLKQIVLRLDDIGNFSTFQASKSKSAS